MPDEFAALKYPSVNRPQKILTSLDGRTNFALICLQKHPFRQKMWMSCQENEDHAATF